MARVAPEARKRPPAALDDEAVLTKCRYSFPERITWTEPLRGKIEPTEKEAADALAIG